MVPRAEKSLNLAVSGPSTDMCSKTLCELLYTGENDFGSYEPPGCILGGVTAMSIYIIRKAEPRSALDYLNIVCFARQ